MSARYMDLWRRVESVPSNRVISALDRSCRAAGARFVLWGCETDGPQRQARRLVRLVSGPVRESLVEQDKTWMRLQ